MLPKIILHNSISIDGSLTNFEVNMRLHYQTAGIYNADAHLIGSNTAKTGIESYGEEVPEEKRDFKKPERDDYLPYWVIIDSNGSLNGLLHHLRRFEGCKDLIILVSEKTNQEYLHYLQKRNFNYHIIGKENIELKGAMELLRDEYQIKTILTDTGRILGDILINQGLVSEVSLLVHPTIVGDKSYNIFCTINQKLGLKLVKNEILEGEYVWLVYKV